MVEIPTPEDISSVLVGQEKVDVEQVVTYVVLCLMSYDGSELRVPMDHTYHSRVKKEVSKRFAAKGWETRWTEEYGVSSSFSVLFVKAKDQREAYQDQRDSVMGGISGGSQEDR